MATVCVVANTNSKTLKTVNIVNTAPPKGGKGHSQKPAAQNPYKQYPTYQPTASTVAGLPTIFISGYSGPS
jgi:hypothetical protein